MNHLTLPMTILIACLVVLYGLFGITPDVIAYPFFPTGDVYVHCRWYLSLLTHGTIYWTPELGAPFEGASHHGFPIPYSLDMLAMAALRPLTANLYLSYNLVYLATFPLCALGAYWALRRFDVPRYPAIAGALLYAFLPNRLGRYEHLAISFQFTTPAIVWVSHQLIQGRPIGRSSYIWVALASLCFVYSAFFCCLIVGFSGLWGSLRTRSWKPLLRGIGLCITATLVTLASLYPALKGPHRSPPYRHPSDIRTYSLALDRVVLPAAPLPEHPLYALSYKHQQNFPNLGGPPESPYLGFAAILGLLSLIFWRKNREHQGSLTVLTVFILVAGSADGLAPLLADLFGLGIRTYNRISFYLGFIGILAVTTSLSRLLSEPRLRWFMGIALTGFCLWEQTKTLPPFDYSGGQRATTSAQEFAKKLPPNSVIWQQPYASYPEHPPQYHEGHYPWAQLYLSGGPIQWSWGEVKGHTNEDFREACGLLPTSQQHEVLSAAGFSGIVVLRTAYRDHGRAYEAGLRECGLKPTLISTDRRFAYYPLPNHNSIKDSKAFSQKIEHYNLERAPLSFTQGSAGLIRLTSGWSEPEPIGVWSDGPHSTIDLPNLLSQIYPAQQKTLVTLELTPHIPPGDSQQKLTLETEHTLLGTWKFSAQNRYKLSFETWLPCQLRLKIAHPSKPGPIAPADQRKLGVMVHRLEARRLPEFRQARN